MGQPKKVRARKVYNYDLNRRRLKKQKRTLPTIRNKEIKKAWEAKSISKNFDDMGLAANPNKSLPIKKPKDILAPMDVEEEHVEEEHVDSQTREDEWRSKPKAYIAEGLESAANTPLLKTFSLPETELAYVKYMVDKYGDDYRAMAKDLKNYYQDTPKQLKKKIKKYEASKSKFKNKLEGKAVEQTES